MTQYQIIVNFTNDQVFQINQSGLKLCLSKGSVPSAASIPLPVAWQAFEPYMDNSITWEEEYNFFASDTTVQGGAVIQRVSETTQGIQLNQPYYFQYGSFQTGGSATPQPNEALDLERKKRKVQFEDDAKACEPPKKKKCYHVF